MTGTRERWRESSATAIFALGQQRVGEIVERALATVAPVTFASRPVVVIAPGIDVLALAPGTLQRGVFPPECMDVGMIRGGVEELGTMRENWHG
jgi:hypothetical protein